jgi:hypothetical protein
VQQWEEHTSREAMFFLWPEKKFVHMSVKLQLSSTKVKPQSQAQYLLLKQVGMF